MNKVILVGNLTRDPEVTVTGSGISMCKFGIAVNRTYASADGEKSVDFFNCTAWRMLGENCGKFLTKGSKVAVSGRIETYKYEKEGVQHNGTTIVCDDVEFLTPKNPSGYPAQEGGVAPVATAVKKPSGDLTPLEDDGLPF